MSRIGSAHDLAPSTPHEAATSTGPGNVQTIAPPAHPTNPDGTDAAACFVTVKTTAARVTFDGSTPDDSPPVGLVIPAGTIPVYFPFAKTINFMSDVAGNSELNVLWLS